MKKKTADPFFISVHMNDLPWPMFWKKKTAPKFVPSIGGAGCYLVCSVFPRFG